MRPPAADASSTCSGETVTVDLSLGQSPTEGDDVIRGTNGNDTIDGLGGDDVICGRSGDDHIDGGDGDDELYGQNGDDVIAGGGGADIIHGHDGVDTIDGGTGDDVIAGGDGDDVIRGRAGHDDIDGDTGDDTVIGGSGNDLLKGSAGHDTLSGGNGNDTLSGGVGDDTLDGNSGTDTANGNSGTDACDAETETNCEAAQQEPQWTSDAEITIDRLSLTDFTVVWGPLVGGVATADTLSLRVYDSNGNWDPWTIIPSRDFEQTVDNFLGDPLDPNEIYSLTLVARNAAGVSQPLLEEIIMPELVVVEEAALQPAHALTASAAFSDNPVDACSSGTTRETLSTSYALWIKTVGGSRPDSEKRIASVSYTSFACYDATTDRLIETGYESAVCDVNPDRIENDQGDPLWAPPTQTSGETPAWSTTNRFECRLDGNWDRWIPHKSVHFDITTCIWHNFATFKPNDDDSDHFKKGEDCPDEAPMPN